ncbi:MAG TPA: hypothetical protein VI408_11105 [Gaiellaceae bacterium]
MDSREETNRAAAEHVAQMRARIEAGRAELDRQQAAVAGTREHLGGISRWIEQTEQHLGEQRARRDDARDSRAPE